METETKTEAETARERDWPNINTTHAVLWPSPHTQAKITLTCPHFHLHSSMAMSTARREVKGQSRTLTGSMDSPGGRWHSAITVRVFGFEQKHVMLKMKRKPTQKNTKREKKRGGVKRKRVLTASG